MGIRVDLEGRRITAAVGDLVAEGARRRLGISLGVPATARARLGSAVHQRYRKAARQAGAEVEVAVREILSKGSPEAILSLWDTSARCTSEDVAALVQAIEQGRKAMRFEGIFDQQEGLQ